MKVMINKKTKKGVLALFRRARIEIPFLLAGYKEGDTIYIKKAVKLRNTKPSPVYYTVDPLELAVKKRELEREGLQILGIWHNHPDGMPEPSYTDWQSAIDGWLYPITSGKETNIYIKRTEKFEWIGCL